MSKWPVVKLGEVLARSDEIAEPQATTEYSEITVRLWGKGVFERGRVLGNAVSGRRFVARTGQFIASRIDARNGAMGLVPASLDGALVTNDFPLFNLNTKRIEPAFFAWLTKTADFVELCLRASEGTTNRVRLKEERFLDLEIPLPPLAEQRRIVARIEELAVKVNEARAIRAQEERQIQQMLSSAFWGIVKGVPRKPMHEVAPMIRRPVEIAVNALYPELGIRSFGKGTFHKPAISGVGLGTKRIFEIKAGDLLFSNVFAWEGAIAVAQKNDDSRFGSHRFMSCVPQEGIAVAPFLCFYFLTDEGMEFIRAASPGGAGRNRTLGIEALSKINVPVPPIEKQTWFSTLQAEVNTLKRLHAETTADLDALLPSVLVRAFKRELWHETRYEQLQPSILKSPFLDSSRLRSKAAIAAYITKHSQGGDFGKTKLAKCYYLLHERLDMHLTEEFQREAAGPWDKEQDAFLEHAAQQGWIELPPEKHLPASAAKGERTFKAILCGQASQQGVDEAIKLLGAHHAVADTLLREMKNKPWELLELWATALDAAKELRRHDKSITAQAVRSFIASVPKWVEHKLNKKPQYYTVQSIENALASLRKWNLLQGK
ncbi:MAG: restriction endonuclease subunit S [Desulfobulbus sp.]|nr:restriction endonuclease subunit S [Desulfobulbus sp.]